MIAQPDVSIRDLHKSFGDVVAVDGLSLDVPHGTFVTILGSSGCGKSTTLRMIGGFETPDRGEISIQGTQMGDTPPHMRPTSMMFQSYALFPHMSVRENIAFGLKQRKFSKHAIAESVQRMLDLMELQGFGDRKPGQLSGGQQQRVALARSLVIEPTVLLLDEPLGALDLLLRKQMQTQLKRIQQQLGITFVYVTHDQEEALAMSDRIVIMRSGRIEQEGSARDIFDKPASSYVAEFMGASNILPVEIGSSDTNASSVVFAGKHIVVPQTQPESDHSALVIRPERIHIVENGGWRGAVTERQFRGGTMTYRVLLDHDVSLVAEIPTASRQAHYDVGDSISLDFRPEDAVLVSVR